MYRKDGFRIRKKRNSDIAAGMVDINLMVFECSWKEYLLKSYSVGIRQNNTFDIFARDFVLGFLGIKNDASNTELVEFQN